MTLDFRHDGKSCRMFDRIKAALTRIAERVPTDREVAILVRQAAQLDMPDDLYAIARLHPNGSVTLMFAIDRIKNIRPRGFMPAAMSSCFPEYTAYHEWGHIVEPLWGRHTYLAPIPVPEWQRIAGEAKLWTNLFTSTSAVCGEAMPLIVQHALSLYGRQNYREAWAEAFAEWHLSGGHTANLAARWYAERFNWAAS